ncbi:hypothetical protein [Nonomuraea sp. NPDC050643]|uniref:hypothetical protein n=1 Tax=Nonomuraea sp. NPDC050643 TaxID=3155660 RepID=UPI0033E9AF29
MIVTSSGAMPQLHGAYAKIVPPASTGLLAEYEQVPSAPAPLDWADAAAGAMVRPAAMAIATPSIRLNKVAHLFRKK